MVIITTRFIGGIDRQTSNPDEHLEKRAHTYRRMPDAIIILFIQVQKPSLKIDLDLMIRD
jgi:hypothetical protein